MQNLAQTRLPLDELLRPAIAAGRGESVPEDTTRAVSAQAAEVEAVDPAQRYEQLTEALCGRQPDAVLQWLHDAGLLAYVLPELEATVDFSQEAGRRHKDVWAHTKEVVWQSVPRPEVRWAAVLHDIGKVPTRRFLPDGRVTFHGHAEVGVRMFRRGPVKQIAFPPDVRERVEALIRYHLRPGQYEPSWTDSAVRRFTKEVGPHMRDLLDLSRADITSKRPGRRRHCLRQISELAKRIRELEEVDAKPKALPPGLGNLLMRELELPPGKHLAALRDALDALCEAGTLEAGQDAAYYVEAVRAHDLLADLTIIEPRRRSRDD